MRQRIVLKSMLAHTAALLMIFAVVLAIFSLLMVRNGADVGQVLAWNGPMPWSLFFMVFGLLVLHFSSRLPQTN